MPTRLSLRPILVRNRHLIVRRRTRRPGKFWAPLRQILLDGLDGLASDGHQALLISLADAADAADAHIDIGNAEIQQFRNAQSRGIQDLQHGPVPQPDRSREVRGLQQLVNFLDPQIRRQAAADFRRLQVLRRVRGRLCLPSSRIYRVPGVKPDTAPRSGCPVFLCTGWKENRQRLPG